MRKFFEYLRHTLWRARLKSCFWVAPVYIGLICIAYLHIIYAVVQISCIVSGVDLFRPMVGNIQSALLEDDPSAVVCMMPPMAELAFSAVFLAALYRRDVVLLRAYCWYVLGCLFIELVVYGLLEALVASLYFIVIILNGIYQIYILMLVRSLIIEIELNITDENKLVYHKDQGVVVIRDVESPTPIVFGGYRVLPALPAPEITTSITTLNEQAPETTLDSKYNTLNKSSTLKTNTLKSYRIQDVEVHPQRSATLPTKDTVVVQRHNTAQIGAIQSLAGPSSLKVTSSNTDTLKRDFINSPTATAGAANVTKSNTAADNENTEDKTKTDAKPAENESKDKKDEVPQKKKRGLFKKATKEQTNTKKDDTKPSQSASETDNVASTSKPPENNPDILKKGTTISTAVQTPEDITSPNNDNAIIVEEATPDPEEKKEDTTQKKKRGLFKKTPKESKKDKEKKKGDKNEES